jgi:hypothetical protein
MIGTKKMKAENLSDSIGTLASFTINDISEMHIKKQISPETLLHEYIINYLANSEGRNSIMYGPNNQVVLSFGMVQNDYVFGTWFIELKQGKFCYSY